MAGKSISVNPITFYSCTLLSTPVTLSVKVTIKSMVDKITLEPAGSVVESMDFFLQMRDLGNI